LLRTVLAYCRSIGTADGIIIPIIIADHIANKSASTAFLFSGRDRPHTLSTAG
jgi:hypothetical protein